MNIIKKYFKILWRGSLFFLNQYIALFLYYTGTGKIFFKLNTKEIWIIGGNMANFYDDNSAAFHQYLIKNHYEKEVYYMIRKNSPDALKVKNYGKVLFYKSIKGNLYSLLSRVLICSHGIRGDIAPFKEKFFKNKIKIFLGHGITALKKMKDIEKFCKVNYDIVTASSDFEKDIFVNYWGVSRKKIFVTGLPRFDLLHISQKKVTKLDHKIFFMPTWRPWLSNNWWKMSEKDYKKALESDFFIKIKNLIFSSNTREVLKKNNIIMEVFLHRNLHLFLDSFFDLEVNKFVKILPQDTNIQKKIIESYALITDYSSIAWDFLFLNKPIIFYQFDIKEYKEKIGSYIKIPDNLPGLVAYDSNQVAAYIDYLVSKNFNFINEKAKTQKDMFFRFNDDNNCFRIMKVIEKKLRE